ncbi:MAG: hypothetical protein H6909_01410 [Rickettsiaceae bacterium]|nr:hypothetical protein [Rickettsiaceae bacterium]
MLKKIIMAVALVLLTESIAHGVSLIDKTIIQKLHITSDSLFIDQETSSSRFKDNVTVYFEDYILKTEELIIFYDVKAKTIEKIQIPYILKIVKQSTQEIMMADQAIYDKKSQQLTLIGNVVVQKGNHILKTDKIIYDIEKLSKK